MERLLTPGCSGYLLGHGAGVITLGEYGTGVPLVVGGVALLLLWYSAFRKQQPSEEDGRAALAPDPDTKSRKKRSTVAMVTVALLVIVALWVLTPLLVPHLLDQSTQEVWAQRGQFGDMYGAVNALFSGLAFVGVIYAILLQREELSLQRRELELTRKELNRSAQAQEELAAKSAREVQLLEEAQAFERDRAAAEHGPLLQGWVVKNIADSEDLRLDCKNQGAPVWDIACSAEGDVEIVRISQSDLPTNATLKLLVPGGSNVTLPVVFSVMYTTRGSDSGSLRFEYTPQTRKVERVG